MKFLISIYFLFVMPALAGNELGNGGNYIYDNCADKYYFYDSYEMEKRYSWKIELPLNRYDEQSIALGFADMLNFYDEELTKQLKHWIRTFYIETRLTDKKLAQINDFNSRITDIGDNFGQLIIQKPANGKLYTIYRPVWEKMDKVQKAVAILHEVIYRRAVLLRPTLWRSDNIRFIVQLIIANKIDEFYFALYGKLEDYLQDSGYYVTLDIIDSILNNPVVITTDRKNCEWTGNINSARE